MKPPKLFLACLAALPAFSVSAEVVISEFLAANNANLADEDGEFQDWIEIENTGGSAVNLAGWHLTDDQDYDVSDALTVWTFPSRVIGAGESLVVFASGKDRNPETSGELHTNFQLSSDGEYLALIEPDGVSVATEFAPEFPGQETDISYGSGFSTLNTLNFVEEGAAGKVLVPEDGSLGTSWTGGAEPFDDSSWDPVKTGIGFDTGGGPAGFTLVDNFDILNVGALDGQSGWTTTSADVAVGIDPADAENRVMTQTGDDVLAWKPINIPDGDYGDALLPHAPRWHPQCKSWRDRYRNADD